MVAESPAAGLEPGPVLWIGKREYMKKDLIDDRFGRYYEIPRRVAAAGTPVQMAVYSYRRGRTEEFALGDRFKVRSFGLLSFPAFLGYLVGEANSGRYRTVVGSGDTPYCLLAVLLARAFGLRSLCDLYDNFETYQSAKIPGMVRLLRWATRHADLNIAFEQTLANFLDKTYGARVACIVPNGADPALFHPVDRSGARAALGIDAAIPVIGYFGSLTAHRGTRTLFDAVDRVAARHPDALFLLAGSGAEQVPPCRGQVRHLGLLPQSALATAIGACDCATICYADNGFAAFSFPQKMMEYIACRVPFVTPAVGGAVPFLADFPGYLYAIGDSRDLADKVLGLLESSHHPMPAAVGWDESAGRFAACIGATSAVDAGEPPKVSVITVCRNAADSIERTITSVGSQTYPRLEYIVIDGASDDDTVARIERHRDLVDLWVSEPDRGISDAMNKGAARATGDLLIFINADDAFVDANAVSSAVRRILERPNHDFFAFCIRFGDQRHSELRCSRRFGPRMYVKTGVLHQGVFCRADAFRRLGGYRLQYSYALDYDFFLRAYLAGMRLASFPEVVSFMSAGGLSTGDDFESVSKRLLQEREIHYSTATGPLWGLFYRLYWPIYYRFKKFKHRHAASPATREDAPT